MITSFVSLFAVLSLALAASGCSQMMGNLRPDLDDSQAYFPDSPATTGGRWSERGLLSEDPGSSDRYSRVGHSERAPAGARYRADDRRRSWVGEADEAARHRDLARGVEVDAIEDGVTYSNTPNRAPAARRMYKGGQRATRADFIDDSQNEGSLWASDGQTNYYFTKNKIRGMGDIVTVTVEQELVRDMMAEITRTLSPSERKIELELAQRRLDLKAGKEVEPPSDPTVAEATKDTVATSQAAPANNKNEIKESREATLSDIDVSKSLDFKAGDTIMAEIVERYPNGNYKIRGAKRVRYRNGFRMVNLVGVVRGTDITEDDQITSGKLYEYRLEALR